MKPIEITRKKGVNALEIRGQKAQEVNIRELQAINGGSIGGVIKLDLIRTDPAPLLTADLSYFVPLNEFLQMTVLSRRMFAILLKNILRVMDEGEKLRFSRNLFVYDPTQVMIEPSSWGVYFIYVPMQPFSTGGTLKDLLSGLMQYVSFDRGEDTSYVENYLSIINNGANFSSFVLDEYVKYLESDSGGAMGDDSLRCPKCNSRISPGDNTCVTCGYIINRSNRYQENSPGFQQEQRYEPAPSWQNNERRDQPIGFPPYGNQGDANPYGGQSSRPSYGGQSNQPSYGGQSNQPSYGGQSSQPSYGGQSNQPSYGGQSNQPSYGGQSSQPSYGGQSSQPSYGGQSNQPSYGGQSNQPSYGLRDGAPYPPVGTIGNMMQNPYGQGRPTNGELDHFNGTLVAFNFNDKKPLGGPMLGQQGAPAPAQRASLMRLKNGSVVYIDRFPFRIGKLRDMVDFAIENTAVSRQHAQIVCERGQYYIVDLNSKNGTFVNGRRLAGGAREPLKNGDNVKLANEEFVLYIE